MLSKHVFMGNGMFGTQSRVVWCILSMCLAIFSVHVVIAVCIILLTTTVVLYIHVHARSKQCVVYYIKLTLCPAQCTYVYICCFLTQVIVSLR